MLMEHSAKVANKLYLHSQDGTCQLVNMNVVMFVVKVIGISDMSAPTAVLQFITNQLIATALEKFAIVDYFHVILMKLENSQDHANLFKLVKMSNHHAATDSFAANMQSSRVVMTSGEIVADFILFKNQDSKYDSF